MAEIGDQHAEGGERPRSRGDDHLGDLQLRGERRGMHRAGAAVSDERVIAWIATLLDGDRPIAADMIALAIRMMPSAQASTVRPRRSREPLDRCAREVGIEAHRAAEKIRRIDPSGDDVGVGDRRLDATDRVRGGPG